MTISVINAILAGLAWIGFFIALYIRLKKTRHQPMVCYVGSDCSKVVHSEYSKFFGLPVELLGMIYYAFLGFSYGTLLLFPQIASPAISFMLFGISLGAFLFSIYLIAIQAIALKEWCTWCICSAIITTIIFLIVVFHLNSAIIEQLAVLKPLMIILHLVGVALGVGAATISDIFFFRFLKDFRISQFESSILGILSQVVWMGVGLLVLSGVGLFLPAAATYAVSSKFLAKMGIVAIIIFNGVLLNFYISPRLMTISFGKSHHHQVGELKNFRRVAFASGAISISSWYIALILGSLKSIPITAFQMLGIYAAVIFFAVSTSQVVESRMSHQALEHLANGKESGKQ
ncbi:MAG: vitamin K epoxide reductase family protein [Candidatus Paceibacterota bacterium]